MFEGVDPSATELLSTLFEPQAYPRGTVVYAQGVPGSTLFVVLGGAVKLTRTEPDGRRRVVSLKGPRESFGELGLFDPGPRTVTATAVAKTCLAALTDVQLRLWIAQRPEVGGQLLKALARRLRTADVEASDLIFRDATSRVAKVLLSLAARLGVEQEDGLHVEHGLNQTELAELAATSREVVNRALGEFAARGWARAEGSSFIVLDAGGLERRSRQTTGRPGRRPHNRASGGGPRRVEVGTPS